ncbi:hypothetical protein ACU686_17960 [Yinghuangia aomiensis]
MPEPSPTAYGRILDIAGCAVIACLWAVPLCGGPHPSADAPVARRIPVPSDLIGPIRPRESGDVRGSAVPGPGDPACRRQHRGRAVAKPPRRFADPVYHERRNRIAELALRHVPGEPIPAVEYTPRNTKCGGLCPPSWHIAHRGHGRRRIPARLRAPRPRRTASRSSRKSALAGAPHRLPLPARGRAPGRAARVLRHARRLPLPLRGSTSGTTACRSTPEPDVVHEVIGHASALASDRFAALYRLAGEAGAGWRAAKHWSSCPRSSGSRWSSA